MSLTDLEQRLLAHVLTEPATATEIYRRFYGLPGGNLSMTTRMRRQRRETAVMLEILASGGHITRTVIERHGAQLVGFSRIV
jgi:hypothetical protein